MSLETPARSRRLIEDWLPIAELSEESVRERRSMTALPPTYYLHVWFARRPLIASRAAILASILPATTDHRDFLRNIGILGDPVKTKGEILAAKITGEDLGTDPYGYQRAFLTLPEPVAERALVLDPTAGGGSVPFEAMRLGCDVVANDLNSVAALLLKATLDLPQRFGLAVWERYCALSKKFAAIAAPHFTSVFPREAASVLTVDGYLWARTVTCPYCGGSVPLSPNWRLSSTGCGVRFRPEGMRMQFEIVHSEVEHSPPTVKGGDGLCPFPDCGRTIDGEEIKRQAQAGGMGHQLYCIVFKEEVIEGRKRKKIRRYRAPRLEDDVGPQVGREIAQRMAGWQARNIIPNEEFPPNTNDDRPRQYGCPLWRDLFNPRQLYGNCISVELFQNFFETESEDDVGRAALVYIALALDKIFYYNNIGCHWDSSTGRVRSMFDRHDFSFKWSYAEMAPSITGLGYEWAFEQTGKSLRELIELLGRDAPPMAQDRPTVDVTVTNNSGDSLLIESQSVDVIVMDPPYYDNVMYAELADFFYVWLKRTAGMIYPDLFALHLTDKDREAVANPAKFIGQKGGSKNLAGRDYQQRMAAIFKEQRRVLKPDGIMTVMFTHKAAGAWDALATGLIEAGFTITASWPINTEAEGSLHIPRSLPLAQQSS